MAVSAAIITAAVGQVINGAATITASTQNRQNVRDQIRHANENKYIQSLDYEQQVLEKDNTGLVVLTIMSVIIISLIMLIMFKK